MREIKFRGKSVLPIEELDQLEIKHKNGWVTGNLITNAGNPFIVGDLADWGEEFIAHEYWVKVIPATVGQYAELKDKNGVEIYEGSVYKYIIQGHFGGFYQEFERKAVVYYEGGAFCVGEYLLSEALEGDDEAEIIGNVHDNPELLEVTN